jgi:hypothetical protein
MAAGAASTVSRGVREEELAFAMSDGSVTDVLLGVAVALKFEVSCCSTNRGCGSRHTCSGVPATQSDV